MAIATKTPGFVSVAATLPITGEMTVKTTVLSIAPMVTATRLLDFVSPAIRIIIGGINARTTVLSIARMVIVTWTLDFVQLVATLPITGEIPAIRLVHLTA